VEDQKAIEVGDFQLSKWPPARLGILTRPQGGDFEVAIRVKSPIYFALVICPFSTMAKKAWFLITLTPSNIEHSEGYGLNTSPTLYFQNRRVIYV
jgi:hypothetical protein